MSSVRSRKVKPEKPAVWFESTADGRIHVSVPEAERIGSATVMEHCPTHEMSWIVRILLYAIITPSARGRAGPEASSGSEIVVFRKNTAYYR